MTHGSSSLDSCVTALSCLESMLRSDVCVKYWCCLAQSQTRNITKVSVWSKAEQTGTLKVTQADPFGSDTDSSSEYSTDRRYVPPLRVSTLPRPTIGQTETPSTNLDAEANRLGWSDKAMEVTQNHQVALTADSVSTDVTLRDAIAFHTAENAIFRSLNLPSARQARSNPPEMSGERSILTSIKLLDDRRAGIMSIAISSKLVLVFASPKMTQLRNLSTGKEMAITNLNIDPKYSALTFSADGTLLAAVHRLGSDSFPVGVGDSHQCVSHGFTGPTLWNDTKDRLHRSFWE